MFSLLAENAILSILPQQRVNLISVDHDSQNASAPAKEATIQGRLTLTLKKPTKLKEVYVKVMAKANVRIGEHYASATILERRVATGWHETVQEGKWEFPFDIPIPSTSPASVASVHGRIAWQIVAVAAGLGRFGADLEAHQSIELIHAPTAPGNTPPALEFDVEAPVHEIGRFRSSYVAIWANIGVLGIAWLSFAGPPVDAEVLDYESKIVEHCSVKNVEEPFQTVEMPPVHAKVFSLKGAPLFKLKAEQPFEHGPTWARLPTHSVIHPSTDPLADSPIRFSHEIIVSFSYRTVLSDEPRTVVQSARCHLYSCVYFEKLPSYSGVVSDQYDHTGMCECEISMERQFAECEQTLLARSSQRRQPKNRDKAIPASSLTILVEIPKAMAADHPDWGRYARQRYERNGNGHGLVTVYALNRSDALLSTTILPRCPGRGRALSASRRSDEALVATKVMKERATRAKRHCDRVSTSSKRHLKLRLSRETLIQLYTTSGG